MPREFSSELAPEIDDVTEWHVRGGPYDLCPHPSHATPGRTDHHRRHHHAQRHAKGISYSELWGSDEGANPPDNTYSPELSITHEIRPVEPDVHPSIVAFSQPADLHLVLERPARVRFTR